MYITNTDNPVYFDITFSAVCRRNSRFLYIFRMPLKHDPSPCTSLELVINLLLLNVISRLSCTIIVALFLLGCVLAFTVYYFNCNDTAFQNTNVEINWEEVLNYYSVF